MGLRQAPKGSSRGRIHSYMDVKMQPQQCQDKLLQTGFVDIMKPVPSCCCCTCCAHFTNVSTSLMTSNEKLAAFREKQLQFTKDFHLDHFADAPKRHLSHFLSRFVSLRNPRESVGHFISVAKPEPPVIRAASSAFAGIFAAANNNCTSVFQEEEDALKPLTQKSSYRML